MVNLNITVMDYRAFGQSDIRVSVIAFGALATRGWLWGCAGSKEAVKAIKAAIVHGMTSIDTTPVYGVGKIEELIGKAIKGKRGQINAELFKLQIDTEI